MSDRSPVTDPVTTDTDTGPPPGELRWMADQLELRNLVARLAQLADTGTIEDYAGCWTEDGEWLAPADSPGVSADDPPRRGRDGIVAGVVHRRELGVQGPGTRTRHVVSGTILARTGPDSATGRSYWRYYVHTDATPELVVTGQYDDEFVRTADGWRLRLRRISRV